ncbi:MAG: hypothetical protein AAFQ60_04195 [Pseudomonadota bacterium]
MPNEPWPLSKDPPRLPLADRLENHVPRLLYLSLTLLSLCVAAGVPDGLSAQNRDVGVNRAEMIRILGELPSAMPIREDLQKQGFSGDNLELAVAQAGSFYKDPTIAGFIADQVIAAYTDPSFEVNPQGLIWPMVARGMGHLPLVELRYYYSVEQAMINALPNRECGQAMRGTYSDKAYADAMSRVAARLETDALREFYRIEFKAAKLGATRGPVALSAATMQDVAAAIDARVEALLDEEPDAVRLRAAMQDIARANNKIACRIGRIFYEAVITLDPKIQRNGLIMLGQQ